METSIGEPLDGAHVPLGLPGQRDDVLAAGALAGGRRCSLRRGAQARLAEVGGVGEARGVALDHAYAGAAVAATGDLLDPAVIQAGHRRALVFDEDFGELSAGSHRRAEDPFENVGFDYIMSGHCCSQSSRRSSGEPTDKCRRGPACRMTAPPGRSPAKSPLIAGPLLRR